MNFEPWEGAQSPPSSLAEDTQATLPAVRIAWIAMHKTKAELMTVVAELEAEHLDNMLDGIIDARDFFAAQVAILDAAEIRIMCAAASQKVRNGNVPEA